MNIDFEFWDTEDTPFKGIKEADFKKAEQLLGIKLPKLYYDLLKIQNGGSTSGFGFPTKQKNTWSENHVPFLELSGIDFKDIKDSKSILVHSEYYREEWGLVDDVYLLVGEGHWWIVLDYRYGRDEPKISWIESEMSQDFVIAETFNEFIAGLRPIEKFNDDEDIDLDEFTFYD